MTWKIKIINVNLSDCNKSRLLDCLIDSGSLKIQILKPFSGFPCYPIKSRPEILLSAILCNTYDVTKIASCVCHLFGSIHLFISIGNTYSKTKLFSASIGKVKSDQNWVFFNTLPANKFLAIHSKGYPEIVSFGISFNIYKC
jgi:hypothetical protein